MLEFLYEYCLFLAKSITLAGAIIIVVAIISRLSRRERPPSSARIKVKKLNDSYKKMERILKNNLLSDDKLKAYYKEEKRADKAARKHPEQEENRKHIFILNFKGDIAATAIKQLREEITAILMVATPEDEVVVRLTSGGGMFNTYGLAASQLQRIKQHKIPLTVAVDTIAASGGYKMACVADRLVAAPYAIIGSIGVISEIPNFYRLLKKNNIDYEQMTAGEHKRTLTIFGENTKAARKKHQEQLGEVHNLFKKFVAEHREGVDLKKVATGEYWYGVRALELNLIDEIMTSDDLLLARRDDSDLLEVTYSEKETVGGRISWSMNRFAGSVIDTVLQKISDRRFV